GLLDCVRFRISSPITGGFLFGWALFLFLPLSGTCSQLLLYSVLIMAEKAEMYVVKRDGRRQDVIFDKITARIRNLCDGLDQDYICPVKIAMKVIEGLYAGVKTSELDELAAQTAAYSATHHPDFSVLAARISISNLHKMTDSSFSSMVNTCHGYVHKHTKEPSPLVSDDLHRICQAHGEQIDAEIVNNRDFDFDYFGFKTLARSYLLQIDGAVVERPQHMYMRVALGIHGDDLERAFETYHLMSQRYFIHASPTLFNAGTPHPQLSSCFVLHMTDDSIDGIYDTLKRCALISKFAGGIGLSVHNIRATGSYIRGTQGRSNGLVPMLRVYNDTALYVDQGGQKRKGSFAVYLEPWHPDLLAFLELRKNHGNEADRARDLFYALWVNDLFMRRVEADAPWSFFCPNEAPGLCECWGAEFDQLYARYEAEGRARKTLPARAVWNLVLQAQVETGTPFVLYKDACNRKSNQQNLGCIKSSNLCCEIVQFTSPEDVAVCNLASLNLSRFADEERGVFDHAKLAEVVGVAARNLDKVIDINFYPLPEAARSNLRTRPLGLGVQGLADAFLKLRLPFDSPQARSLHKEIFETIYFAAADASVALAAERGPYPAYAGSPASEGRLQFDLWAEEARARGEEWVPHASGRWDWPALRRRLRQHGLRNSLLTAPMPTATTAQILGNNESFEPFTSNMYTRRVLAGEFVVVNKYLLRDLVARGLWTPAARNQLLADQGSVQNLPGLPAELKALYKTVWEVKQRHVVDLAADRGPFVDQSQSMNVHFAQPTAAKLTAMHFYAWRRGLKTGMYYLRTKPRAQAIQFTVDQGLVVATAAAAA
ncbi:unnamed protein product, partial [Heterosigma akashiwo]